MTTGNSVADYKVERFHTCEDCGGSGNIKDPDTGNYNPCDRCKGKGYYEQWK